MRRTAAGLVLLALAGCGGGTAAAPGASSSAVSSSGGAVPEVPGMAGEVVRLRTDEAVGGRVQVRITGTGSEGFTVTSVALDSPGFAPLPATAVTTEYAPGRTIDLPVPYGAPRCATAPEPAVARVSLIRPDGAVEQVRLPLAGAALGTIHAEECAVLAVTEVVVIGVSGLRAEGEAVRGALTLTRRGAADVAVRVDRLDRSVLVDVFAPGLPLELDRGAVSVSAPVSFTPATCDPHVLAETKKPYVFPLAVTVGDEEPVPVDLPLDDAARALLAELVNRFCAGR